MKKQSITTILLLLITFATSQAQDDKEFSAYANKEKMEMLKAYARKDLEGYRKILDDFISRYDKYKGNEKVIWGWQWQLKEEYYLMADLYALTGKTTEAVDYLEKADNYAYEDLMQDHDLDNIRKKPEFVNLQEGTKKTGSGNYHTASKATNNYAEAMEKIKKIYNKDHVNTIDRAFTKQINSLLKPAEVEEIRAEKGKMTSYKYMAQDSSGRIDYALFKVTFENATDVVSFSLDETNKLNGGIAFGTSSVFIDKLLAKEL